MGHYAAIIRFALWGILICAAAVQSQANATSDQQGNRNSQSNHRPTRGGQQIELMVPGFAANAPYQELRITKPAVAEANIQADSSQPTAEAAEGSANVIQEFVEFTGTAVGQLVAAGLILTFCWRVARRIQREEIAQRSVAALHRITYQRVQGRLRHSYATVISAKQR